MESSVRSRAFGLRLWLLALAGVLAFPAAPAAAQKLHLRGCDDWSCHRFTVFYMFTPDPFGPGWMDGTARLSSSFTQAGLASWFVWSARELFLMGLDYAGPLPPDQLPENYFDLGLDPNNYFDPTHLFSESGTPSAGSRSHFVDVGTAASYEPADAVVYVSYADGTTSAVHMSSTVPEPMSLLLLGTGLLGVGALHRRRRSR